MAHPFIERILDGDIPCSAEINEFNANKLLAWVENISSHHLPEDCTKGKNCVHSPGQDAVDYAARLINEMPELCTCGEHK